MSFGIRNVPDVQKALKEMYRVLRPGGQVYILEFSLAKNFFIRFFQKIYLRTFVPVVGGYLSGSKSAYSYLDKSIEAFSYGDYFVEELHKAGFSAATYFPLNFGIVTIYVARR
jgi:demethylmenaquinone methyltransferase/2-methoxy-6-polyprenyl-1,4-benzoquinol methylase